MNGPLARLSRVRRAMTRRASSYDRSGGNTDWTPIKAGRRLELLNVSGPGRVTHMWATFMAEEDPLIKRNLVLRAFWDGQDHPSVESPIGDFFGQGWGLNYPFSSLPLVAAPRAGRSLVCYFPMPFSQGARIEVENQSAADCDRFYYSIDYESSETDPAEGRFHAWYNQELTKCASPDGLENAWEEGAPDPTNQSDRDNYLVCEVNGTGHFVGLNLYVNSPSPVWPGEGDETFLIDGEPWPGLHGTGTEDCFNTAWGPDDLFSHPCFGIAYVSGRGNGEPRFGWLGRTHLYRFYLDDPVRFQRSLRASIEHGHANGMELEMASVAYWYQLGPSSPLPPIPPAEARRPRPVLGPETFHRWRQLWRANRPAAGLWGDEG